jgi:small conductance mechanosensitive channel
MIDTFTESLFLELEQFTDLLPRLIFGILVIFLFYLLGKLISRIYDRILQKTSLSESNLQYFQRLIVGVSIFIGFIFFLNIIGFQTFAASLLAGGGIVAVMLGFAFRDIGENLLAGFFLAFSRPFNKGDLIESDGLTGRVQNIQLRHTHIRTGDGCDIFVPSAQLFTKPLHNYTLDGLRRGNFTVGIDYTDDAEKACQLLLETVQSVKRILKKPAPSVTIKGFDPDYVELQVSFWINVKDQESTLPIIRTSAMNACRISLINAGFTFSSNVSTNVDLGPVDVRLDRSETNNS